MLVYGLSVMAYRAWSLIYAKVSDIVYCKHEISMSFKTGRYQHYKGQYYEVIDTVRHSEDETLLVLYKPLYGEGKLWVRPFDMFFEEVSTPSGNTPRFKWISD